MSNNNRLSRKELAKRNIKQNNRRKNLRTLMIIAVTSLFVYITGLYGASLAYLGDFISGGMTYLQLGGGFPVEDDFSNVMWADNMGSGLAVLTTDSFDVYSPTAKKVFSYSHSLTEPVVSTSKHRAVLYGANGTQLKIANNHNILFQQEMENNIIHADISDSNRVAVTTRSQSYNGEVRVYNYNMKQRFAWYCATGFPVYSILSDSGKSLAICTVQTDGGLLQSEIFIIDVAKGEEKFTIKSGKYPQKLIFADDSKLIIAYSDSVVMWDTVNNAQLGQYSFNGENLLAIENAGAYTAVACGNYSRGSRSTVVLLSNMFEQKLKVTIPQGLKDLSLSASRIYALGYENIYQFDYNGNLLDTVSSGALAKQLVTWKGTVLIDSTSITRLEKTKSR